MKPIPAFKLILEPLRSEAAALPPFKWAGGDVGQRHRIGGKPDLMPEADFPVCSCGKPMSFYGQLDSLNDEFTLADCGLIQVFVRFDCFKTKSVLTSA